MTDLVGEGDEVAERVLALLGAEAEVGRALAVALVELVHVQLLHLGGPRVPGHRRLLREERRPHGAGGLPGPAADAHGPATETDEPAAGSPDPPRGLGRREVRGGAGGPDGNSRGGGGCHGGGGELLPMSSTFSSTSFDDSLSIDC